MKRKFARNRYTKKRELLITSQRGEILDTRRAQWLATVQSDVLLRFDYEMARDGIGATLHYDVQGLVSLPSFLKRRVLDDAAFIRLVSGVQQVLDTCLAQHIPTEHIVFDPTLVFVDEVAQPRFVVVPLDNVPYVVGNTPLTMLRTLGETRRLAFSSPSAEGLSAKLEVFVLNQNNVFSGNQFRSFLHDQCGVGRAPRTNRRTVFAPTQEETREHGETILRMWNPVDSHHVPELGSVTSPFSLERLSRGEIYPIPERHQVQLGRGSKNDIQIVGNPKLSRNHARVFCTPSWVTLTDLGSANGTWVQGQRLEPHASVRFPLGQVFSLANEDFVVRGRS